MSIHLILRTSGSPTAGEVRDFGALAIALGVPTDQLLTAHSSNDRGLEVLIPDPWDLADQSGRGAP